MKAWTSAFPQKNETVGELIQRFHGSNHIEINHHRPRPEERAPERLSKDARVSKDGHKRDRARGHPSRRPRQERGLLRMRSEGGECDVRYDWFHGIDELVAQLFARFARMAARQKRIDHALHRARCVMPQHSDTLILL